jgi:hypothetical protein
MLRIKTNSGTGIGNQATLRVFLDEDGKDYFGYCTDLGVDADAGNFSRVLFSDADESDLTALYGSEENAKRVEMIVQNGFWARENGLGSLDAFKETLKAYGIGEDVNLDDLTYGAALSATQAAIWQYGHSRTAETTLKITEGYEEYGPFLYVNDGQDDYKNPIPERDNAEYQKQAKLANQIYQFLIGDEFYNAAQKADAADTGVSEEQLVTKDAITGSSLSVSAMNDDGTYDADVKVSLNVKQMVGDLFLKISDAVSNIKEKVYRIAGVKEYGEMSEELKMDNDGNVNISGLKLRDGANLILNLFGTQNLGTSVYLLKSQSGINHAQSFITIGQQVRDVDVSTALHFNANDFRPDFALEQTEKVSNYEYSNSAKVEWTESRSEQLGVNKEATEVKEGMLEYSDEWSRFHEANYRYEEPVPEEPIEVFDTETEQNPPPPVTPPAEPTAEEPPVEEPVVEEPPVEEPVIEEPPVEEPVIEEIPDEPTPLAEIPEMPAPEEPVLEEIPDEEVPLAEMPEELMEIPDEEVPLANVPATGDESLTVLWTVMSLVSLGGVIVLLRKREGEEA